MSSPLKDHSISEIERKIANCFSELTGEKFIVNIQKMETPFGLSTSISLECRVDYGRFGDGQPEEGLSG